jgi:membrane-bound hydrogenase subunit beta
MTPQAVLASLRESLGERLLNEKTVERKVGKKAHSVYDVWIEVDRETLHEAVSHLCALSYPHLSVISGDDLGKEIAFNYHFTVGFGERYGEMTLSLRVRVPKNDLRLPTITDLIAGAVTSEREKQEFFGVLVDGIPDGRNLFLSEEMSIHPWRKDLAEETAKEVKRLVKWEERRG